MKGVPTPNWTQVPNDLLDKLLPDIDSLSELKVLLAIVRATAGWHVASAVLTFPQLEEATGLSRNSVRDGLRRAHDRGYVEKTPVGSTHAYGLVVDGQLLSRGGDTAPGSISPPRGGDSDPPEGEILTPHVIKKGKKPSGGKKAFPATINGVRVKGAEGDLAVTILAVWNEVAGQSFSGSSWVARILRRMREHPELTLEDHRRVIESVLRGGRQWWTGDPDPRIIYGNDGQFEACLAQSRRVTSVQSEEDDGRDWNAGYGPKD